MSFVEFAPVDVEFPMPVFDRLGLANDALLVAGSETESGQEFVAVHTRPFAGEALNFFLNDCAYTGYTNTQRKHAQATYRPLKVRGIDPNVDEAGRAFIKEQARLHHQVGKFGIGAAMRAFERDVRRDWDVAFDNTVTDSVYYPLMRTQVYEDLSRAAVWQVGEWKSQMPKEPVWWGAEAVYKVLVHVAPNDELEEIHDTYAADRRKAWEDRRQDREGANKAYEKFGKRLSEYLERLPVDSRNDIVGRAYSQLANARQGSVNHTSANRLIVDLASQRHWIEMPHVYDMKLGVTDELLFPEPLVEFVGDTVRISDDNGTAVTLHVHANDDATAPVTWSIGDYALPASQYTDGRYPALAWQIDRSGRRVFHDHSATVRAVHEAGLPIQGAPDSYLGKLMVKYFGQEGEYRQSDAEKKWLPRMGLPGSEEKRDITIRELPVWIQLPQHQADLLNSQFIKAAEVFAKKRG